MRLERHDLDGAGSRPLQVYDMPTREVDGMPDYWAAVTDVPCPAADCTGTIRWAEAGHAPGYRICDGCGQHYMAGGRDTTPTLMQL